MSTFVESSLNLNISFAFSWDMNKWIEHWAMILLQYEHEIVHRPRKSWGHVNALNRCHSILVIEGNTFEKSLALHQECDEEIRRIRKNLEKKNDKLFESLNGLIYRKVNKNELLFYVL